MHTLWRSLRPRWARLLALVVLLGVLPSLAAAAERLQVAQSTLTATNAVLWVARDRGFFQRGPPGFAKSFRRGEF